MKKIEIIEKRKLKEKHFLKENGEFIVELYEDNIHFLKNGCYEEIDNTLILEDNYYVNKNNNYKLSFSKEKEKHLMKIEKQGHYIKIDLENYNSFKIEKENISKLNSRVKYKEILKNIDICYDVISSRIKENIYINNKESELEKLVFNIETDLSLRLNQDGSINASYNGEQIFIFNSLYMLDNTGKRSNKVSYVLKKEENLYKLFILVDNKWLEEATYPVIIDPTIDNAENNNSVYDTFIYPGDTNTNRNNLDHLKVGVEKANIINRTLLKFELPVIGTGSQIIKAELLLQNYPLNIDEYVNDTINVHRITDDWSETTANWNTMNDKFDNSRVDGVVNYFNYGYDYTVEPTLLYSTADITSLVQKWYTGTKNYGVLLKLEQEKYKNNLIPKFISKNNTVNQKFKPMLILTYRNQNGLLNTMNYETQGFNKVTTFHNTYNGNLTSIIDLVSTKNSKMPCNLELVYNTNDVVLNNNIGYGLGYRLNLCQTIKETKIEQKNYLEYIDEDGTTHYFLNEKTKVDDTRINTTTFETTFFDEDGLDLEIEKFADKYILKDKDSNTMTFIKNNEVGYLKEIKDTSGNIITISYDTENRISSVKDEINQTIELSYSTNTITVAGPYNKEQVILQYSNNTLTRVDYNYSGTTSYLLFENNENNIISKITDETNQKIKYEYYSETPYKIRKISEYGRDDTLGNYYTINYGFNTSTIIDPHNRVNTITYNNTGCPESIVILKDKDSIVGAYGSKVQYGESILGDNKYKNKLLANKMPIGYVKNLLSNSSFEETTTDFNINNFSTSSITTEYAYTGFKSLLLETNSINGSVSKNVVVEKGKYYTFSAHIKTLNNCKVKLYMSYNTEENKTIEYSEITISNDFERLDTTIFYPSNATSQLEIGITIEEKGKCYIDDVQLEEGEVVNNYNLIENSDFSQGLNSWELNTSPDYNTNDIFKVVDINNQKAVKISMYTTNSASLSKNFKIAGKQGECYTLSFWYKNKGLDGAVVHDGEGTRNNIFVSFLRTDGIGDDNVENYILNPNEEEWQYFIHDFYSPNNFKEFTLNFLTDLNANELYITNINLYKNVRSVIYDYDDDGNIIMAKNLNNETSKFNYDKNNQLIKSIDPKGNNLIYEYDNIVTDKILRGTSETGITNEYEYNFKDNPVTTRITNRGQMIEAKDGSYKIRLKGTNKAIRLINNSIKLDVDIHGHDKWIIEKTVIDNKDYYKIFHNIIKKSYLTNENDNLILSNYQNEKSLFELIKQDNGSFYIKNKSNNKYLKHDNNNLMLTNLENDENFEFYFEEKTSGLFIENNTEYTEDGRFITKTIDTNFNEVKYDIDEETGFLNSITDSKDQTTYFTYDGMGKILSSKTNDKVVNYEYDSSNMLSKIIQDDRIYSFTYDEFLNIKNIKIGNITLITNNYEENNGKLISSIYGNGQTINYEYDEFDRIKKLIKNNNTYNYKYNSNGDLVKILSSSDTIKYTYDLAKRLYEYKYNDFKIKYTYNSNDVVINKKYSFNEIVHNINNILNKDDSVIKTIIDEDEINYIYDDLGRIISSNINNSFHTNYEYVTNGKRTSMLIENLTIGNDKYSYVYDSLNNITHIYHNDNLENEYYYDEYTQLIREDNYLENKTFRYVYDNLGNILYKKEFQLNTYNQLSQNKYEYNNENFKDQLTKFNNETITYDNLGNPTKIGENITLDWINGRQLNSYIDNNQTINYKYDVSGLRKSKIVNNVETKYLLEGTKIIFEQTGEEIIYFMRDNLNDLIGFKYNDEKYYYIRNDKDDIIAIMDSENNIIVKYKYDSWGNIISIVDENNNNISNNLTHIGNINPYRYRSYYYDKETKLYYLNSRYYNPLWGRFLNIDGIISSGNTIEGNLYSYCANDPINNIDENGQKWLKNLVNKVKKVVKKIAKVVVNIVKELARVPLRKATSVASIVAPGASEMLNHSMQNKPKNVYYSSKTIHAKNVKNSTVFKNKMEEIAPKLTNQNVVKGESVKLSGTLDLTLGYHNVNIIAEKISHKKAIVTIYDDYDFERWNYKKPSSFKNIKHDILTVVNNIGDRLFDLGIFEKYTYYITFDYQF